MAGFMAETQAKGSPLSASYVVSGISKTGLRQISLLDMDQLDSQTGFSSIDTTLLYSLQPNRLLDTAAIVTKNSAIHLCTAPCRPQFIC